MPKTIHRPGFVPPPMGLSYTAIDAQGRISVPEDFRPTFAPTKPPFEIVFSLTARGLVTVHPADGWPTQSERGLLSYEQIGSARSAFCRKSSNYRRLRAKLAIWHVLRTRSISGVGAWFCAELRATFGVRFWCVSTDGIRGCKYFTGGRTQEAEKRQKLGCRIGHRIVFTSE